MVRALSYQEQAVQVSMHLLQIPSTPLHAHHGLHGRIYARLPSILQLSWHV